MVDFAVSNSTMFPHFNFVDCLIMLLGLLLCFKRVGEMERFHELRVFILMSMLGGFLLLLLLALGNMSDDSNNFDCPPEHFCQREM